MTPTTTSDPPADPERFQFRIRDLLVVMLLIGLALAAAAQQNGWLFLALLVAAVGSLIYWKHFTAVSGITVLVLVGTLFVLFWTPMQNDARTPARGTTIYNNLRQIGFALEQYHDVYGSFPPAYIADKNGRPMHSWRVLILPYMEHEDVYKQYRFDEPWDGPNNRKLARAVNKIYACPDLHWKYTDQVGFVAILGPHTAWSEGQPLTRKDFPDGMENVLHVVEVHDSGIHWMEPRDLHVTQMATTINAQHGQGISSARSDYAYALLADGSVRRLPAWLPAKALRSWIHRDDGTLREPPEP